MNCRIMKRDEFVARLMADQELRKQRSRKLRAKAMEDIIEMAKKRREKYLRRTAKRGRR